MSAKVTRQHRETASRLVKVPRVQPRCVEQWVEGMMLPTWAEQPFAEVVAIAQALAAAAAAERADVIAECERTERTSPVEGAHTVMAMRVRIQRGEHARKAG